MDTTQEERVDLLETVRRFVATEVAPLVADCDREERIPRSLLERTAALGVFGAAGVTDAAQIHGAYRASDE